MNACQSEGKEVKVNRMKVKLSLHSDKFRKKPEENKIKKISKEIASCQYSADMQELAYKIGEEGRTFCPAVFKGVKRIVEDFEEMQIFALDFDCGIPFEVVKERADRYYLPIAFAYHTFSSTEEIPKFRVIFLNDVPVTDRHAAKIMILMLMKIFGEADKFCNDVSRMFFGGKGLIGNSSQESINIVELTISFQRYMFETQPKNYVREIKQFADTNQIACINNCLQISCVHENGTFEDFTDIDPYIYGSGTEFPSNCPKYMIRAHSYQTDVRRKSQICYEELRLDFKDIGQKCQLYHDFVKEEHIPHNERFLLLTNLLHISGGNKRFQSIIGKKNYNKTEWRFYAKYAKDRGYKPQACEGNCPYATICNHGVNMVNTVRQKERIRKVCEEERYDHVDEVYKFISDCLNEAISSPVQGIHLIPAQTAVGKTEAYCNLVGNRTSQRFLIAVPTNHLKREVGNRLQQRGVKAEITLSLDEMDLAKELDSKIKFYYQIGLGQKVVRLLRDYMEENKNADEPEIMNTVNQCRNYLKAYDNMEKYQVLVTTHARLLTFSPDIIKQYTVIIDEDILSTIFKNIRTVSFQTIQTVFDSEKYPAILKGRLEQVIELEDGKYGTFHGISYPGYLSETDLEELEICDNVNEIVTASTFHKEGINIHYFSPQMLAEGKYIILSATSEADLYRMYFSDRCIKDYPYHRAKYQGRLKQLTAYSMSRQCMSDYEKELETFLEQLQSRYQVITFKKFKNKFGNPDLHFGNSEGVDYLNGKNVMVIGTPHLEEFVYKLIGCHLGLEVNSDVLSVRRIRYKGYEFGFMTYKSERLRNLQTYFIGKELEQCIGRARLLRNNCMVLVFSNFPCEQAELIQEDYLRMVGNCGLIKACSPDMAGE